MSKVEEDGGAQGPLQLPVDTAEAASAGAALLVLAAEKAFELASPEDRRIYKLSTNTGAILEIFETLDAACTSNARLTRTKLLRALRGTTKTCGGFAWCYADEHAKHCEGGDGIYEDNEDEEDGPDDEEFVDEGDTKPRRRGMVFGSSVRSGVSSAPVAAAVAESIAHLPTHLPSFSHLHSRPATSAKRRVVKISMHPDSLGKILSTYPSIRLAADSIGVERSLVSKCCRGINVSAGGFMWRYEDAVAAIAADAETPMSHVSRTVHNRVVSSVVSSMLHDSMLAGGAGLGRGGAIGNFSSRFSHIQESQQSGGFIVLSHRTVSSGSSRGAPTPSPAPAPSPASASVSASSSSSSSSSSSGGGDSSSGGGDSSSSNSSSGGDSSSSNRGGGSSDSSSGSSSTAAAATVSTSTSTDISTDISDGSSHSIVVGAAAGVGPVVASPEYIEVLVQYREAQMWVELDELLDKLPQAFVFYMKHLQPMTSRSLSALIALQESGVASQTQSSGAAAAHLAPVPAAAAATTADPAPTPLPAAGQKRAREPDGQEG